MAKIIERIKEQVLQEQVLQKYRRIDRLEQLAREGLPLYESEKKELMELQQEYERFILQPEVVRLISPALKDFQRQAREGNLPTPSDIAEVIIPILLEAADADRIFISHNPGRKEIWAKLIQKIGNGAKLIQNKIGNLKPQLWGDDDKFDQGMLWGAYLLMPAGGSPYVPRTEYDSDHSDNRSYDSDHSDNRSYKEENND